MSAEIRTKRIYEEPSPEDGFRILTERLWPRGVSKEQARLGRWMKGIAPSHELREWFSHDPDKWEEFQERYLQELHDAPAVEELLEILDDEPVVTFIYASRDEKHNSTLVLKEFMEQLRRV